jgi:hypothetical protein
MMSLKEQIAEYRTGWYQRVPAERRAIMERHIELCGRRLNARVNCAPNLALSGTRASKRPASAARAW